MTPSLLRSLTNLSEAWRSTVSPAARRTAIFALVLVFTVAMFVARVGTVRMRALAAGGIVLAFVVVVLLRMHERRSFRDPARTLRRIAGRAAPELAERAVRALSLFGPAASRGASPALAELHAQRAISAIPMNDVTQSASRTGFWLGIVALAVAATNVAACATNPWGVIEGFDVLLARNDVAPFGMAWLADPQVRARAPDYLHLDERGVAPYDDAALHRGTLITVRGTPVHQGRRLLLTDGQAEVPFVDDGNGQVVARWPLAGSVALRVVARFGDVVVPEPQGTAIESIPDAVPTVTLETAPRRIVLAAEAETAEIPIRYEASDDHGLREVHLVLRSGVREDRRVLARLDGETKSDRGGHRLKVSDPFIKKSHAPVEIRVEAKDNDPVTGPKWGASEAILVVPPEIGDPEARRFAAMRKLRDALVDSLAWRLTNAVPSDAKARREFFEHETKSVDADRDLLESTVSTSFAGARISGRLAAMLRGRMRKVKEAVAKQAKAPTAASHAAVVKANERIVLVVDAVIQGFGVHDTRATAKELADVADDIAVAATIAQKSAEKNRGEQRMDAAVMVIEGGGRSMLRLGALGRDLGEITEMDLLRIARARSAGDLTHAALAAQDLAARLRQPDPSFGARGGRPSHAGGESGGGRGTSGGEPDEGEGEGSDVDEAFNEAARELDKLAADHAANAGKTEELLAGAFDERDRKALAEEAKKHADNVREAARPLPSVGGGSDSWTSKGAAAREHAEQMARSLEQGNAADAVQSGRNAVTSLEESRRALARERWGRSSESAEILEEAKRSLEAELKWAEEKLAELKKRAEKRAGPELAENGENEGRLAERARDLGQKGRDQDELPPAALEALKDAERAAREAEQALRRGDADQGLSKQREAQQKLEMARDALGDSEAESGEDGDGSASRDHTDIPKADQHKGPEEFRKRVIKGLSQPSNGRLKDAVKRYAEGLLR